MWSAGICLPYEARRAGVRPAPAEAVGPADAEWRMIRSPAEGHKYAGDEARSTIGDALGMMAGSATFEAVIGVDGEGYFASIPGPPSCFAVGDTPDEAVRNIRDVAALSFSHAGKFGLGAATHDGEAELREGGCASLKSGGSR